MQFNYDMGDRMMDSNMMRIYGIDESQYYDYNSDYRKLLLDNYLKIINKEDSNKERSQEKTKVLSLLKRK